MIGLVGASAVVADEDPAALPALRERARGLGALDLRVAASPAWAAAGFQEVAPGELALPLALPLAGVADTERLGARVAGLLRAGDLVVLSGPLGAGKTAFTRGLGAGLGVTGPVTSPTFVLARRHPGPLPLLHVDAYRLRGSGATLDDLADLDLDDVLAEGVVAVEWGEGVVEGLAGSRLVVRLDRGAQEDARTATVAARGERWRVLAGEGPGQAPT